MRPHTARRLKEANVSYTATEFARLCEQNDESAVSAAIPDLTTTDAGIATLREAAQLVSDPNLRMHLELLCIEANVLRGDWRDFDRDARRAESLLRGAIKAEQSATTNHESSRDLLRVARMKWHLATAQEATGVAYARRCAARGHGYLAHCAHTALGLWALNRGRIDAACNELRASIRAGAQPWDELLVLRGPAWSLSRALLQRGVVDSAINDFMRFAGQHWTGADDAGVW